MRTRREIYALGAKWNDTVLWYARGVKAMQAGPVDDPKSWAFQAAMHGYEKTLWSSAGYPKAGETLPAAGLRSKYWLQCQHQSWYFLPWHRAYLLAFERIMLAEIVALNGPADWALPYWN